MLTKDRIDKHALQAVDCPPATWVVLRSAMHRLIDKESAATAPLLARIAELDRSLDVMAKNTEAQAHASLQREIELTEKVEKMTRELEEARKDAERYRWLRDGSNWPAVFASHDAPEPLRGEDLDAAIKEQT